MKNELSLHRRRKGGRRFYANATKLKSCGASSPTKLCRRKGGLKYCPIFSVNCQALRKAKAVTDKVFSKY